MIERMSAKIIDPVCDMVVEVETAREQGLTLDRPEREYAFCSHGCLVKFSKSPQTYIAKERSFLGP
jgi:YHS domain-containing protein